MSPLVLIASFGHPLVWHLRASKVGQDCRKWLGAGGVWGGGVRGRGWGPVPLGNHLSGRFSVCGYMRGVLRLKIATWATLSSWWMLSSSVPMYRHCCYSVLKLFLRIAFISMSDIGCVGCSTCFPLWMASQLPHCLHTTVERDPLHWRVTDMLLSGNSSCLM